MKSLVFDAGPIISLTINDLLWLLEPLKKSFKGEFLISKGIKKEVVDKPLNTKRFKFGALKVQHVIDEGIITNYDDKSVLSKANELIEIANNCYYARGQPINIVHFGEISGIAIAIIKKSSGFVVDERTTRLLIENPDKLKQILSHTLHTNIRINDEALYKFKKEIKDLKVIRSVELVTIAYEMGLLDSYLIKIEEPRKTLLESVLWGLKLNGCSVSKREINQILKLEIKK